jgi:hypothetical protein
MSVDDRAFHPQGFLLGQAMAKGLPTKRRVTAGVLLAVSPNPVGVAATLSMVRSARRARAADEQKNPDGEKPPEGKGEGQPGETPSDAEMRRQIITDTKEMLDAVTDAASAVELAARSSIDMQTAALAAINQSGGSAGAGAAPATTPPPPASPPTSAPRGKAG